MCYKQATNELQSTYTYDGQPRQRIRKQLALFRGQFSLSRFHFFRKCIRCTFQVSLVPRRRIGCIFEFRSKPLAQSLQSQGVAVWQSQIRAFPRCSDKPHVHVPGELLAGINPAPRSNQPMCSRLNEKGCCWRVWY